MWRGVDDDRQRPARTPCLSHLAQIKLEHPSPAAGPSNVTASITENNVTTHLLPDSISPTMDLALVFTTTAPSASAAATSGQGSQAAGIAGPANQAGLSAAQRLIQQRMAMMRARAAAAAGIQQPSSSASADSQAGPLKGRPIEMSFWRTGDGAERVWKRSITLPDALFEATAGSSAIDARNKAVETAGQVAPFPGDSRPQQKIEVAGMQWSPNGRRLALHIIASRRPGDLIALIALYAINDGHLDHLTQLSRCSSADDNIPRGVRMQWITTQLPADVSRRSATTLVPWYLERPNIAAFVNGLNAQMSGGAGGGRFQHLVGGGGGGGGGGTGQSTAQTKFWPPSQRGLVSETCADKEDGEQGDYIRGWNALALNDDSAGESLTCLVVAGYQVYGGSDRERSQGFHFLVNGKVPIVFAALEQPQGREDVDGAPPILLASHLDSRGDVVFLSGQQEGRSISLKATDARLSCLMPTSTEATLLTSYLDLSSSVRYGCLLALDQAYSLVSLFKTLSQPSPDKGTSLSAHQVQALPPLRRLQRTLHELANSHVQNMQLGLVTTLCTGIHSDMIESLLLNSWSEGKWRTLREAVVKVYEVMEFVGGQLVLTLSELTRRLGELRGLAEWPEASHSLLPLDIDGVTLQECVQQQVSSVSVAQTTALQLIHYAQGERLAWDEMDKWVTWERDRLDSLKSERTEPLDPRTFDPIVVAELALREFECIELNWLLLGQRRTPESDAGDNASVDASHQVNGGDQDSGASFQIERGGNGHNQNDDSTQAGTQEKMAADKRETGESDQDDAMLESQPGPDSRDAFNQAFAWLESGGGNEETAEVAPSASQPQSKAFEDDKYQKLFQAGTQPLDDDRPSVYLRPLLYEGLCQTSMALKAIFRALPDRMQGQVKRGQQICPVADLEVLEDDRDEKVYRVTSLAAPPSATPSTSQTAIARDHRLQRRIRTIMLGESSSAAAAAAAVVPSTNSSVAVAARRLLTVVNQTKEVLLVWQPLSDWSSVSGHGTASKLRLSVQASAVEIQDEARLVVVGGEGRCPGIYVLSLDALESLAQPSATTTTTTTTTREAPVPCVPESEWISRGLVTFLQPLQSGRKGEEVSIAVSGQRNSLGALVRGDSSANGGSGKDVIDFWDVEEIVEEEQEGNACDTGQA